MHTPSSNGMIKLNNNNKPFMHMPKYDPDIHHRRSIRLTHYDYAQAGCYFVTLCAVNRECVFGEILAGEMHLNELGVLVQHEWLQTPVLRPNVSLGEWVVMPNHFHGIVQIDEERGCIQYAPTVKSPSQTLGAIIRGFKAAVTRQAHRPVWQRNYWEHIIRHQQSYDEITTYIANNPAQWEMDSLHL